MRRTEQGFRFIKCHEVRNESVVLQSLCGVFIRFGGLVVKVRLALLRENRLREGIPRIEISAFLSIDIDVHRREVGMINVRAVLNCISLEEWISRVHDACIENSLQNSSLDEQRFELFASWSVVQLQSVIEEVAKQLLLVNMICVESSAPGMRGGLVWRLSGCSRSLRLGAVS